MKRVIGLSTGFDSLNRPTFCEYAKAGIGAFELSIAYELHSKIDLAEISKAAVDEGVDTWSYHLPFYPFEILNVASPDSEIRKYSVGFLSELIKKAGAHGFKHVILHPSAEPISPEDRPAATEHAKESLFSLGRIAEQSGTVLAVEDLPRTCLGNCSAELADLISVHPALRVCFDVNHLLFESHTDFMKNLGEKIATVHISDYDFINERHWLPLEGKIDWKTLLKGLDEIGYQGVFMYEVPRSAANISRPAPLVPEDYVENYNKLLRM